jgi:hypothetical protein
MSAWRSFQDKQTQWKDLPAEFREVKGPADPPFVEYSQYVDIEEIIDDQFSMDMQRTLFVQLLAEDLHIARQFKPHHRECEPACVVVNIRIQDYAGNVSKHIGFQGDNRISLQVQGASRGLVGRLHGAFLRYAFASQAGGTFSNLIMFIMAADAFIQVRKVEHQKNLAPVKWWKRIWNSFWRFLNSPSENLMELLPVLDGNDIIGIKTEALGAISPAHRRFRESEPLPDDDGSFTVPMSEVIIPNLSSDVPSSARSFRSPKTTRPSAATEKSDFASANTLNSRTAVNHSQVWPNISSSAQPKTSERFSNPNSSAASFAQLSLSCLLKSAKTPLDEPEILVPGSIYNSRTMMKWRNYLHQLEISKAQDEYDAAADLEGHEEFECTDSFRSDENPSNLSITELQSKLVAAKNPVVSKNQRIVGHSVVISTGQEYRERIISRSDTELCDAVSFDEDWGPSPPFPEDVWGSNDEEDWSPPSAYDKKATFIVDAFEIEQRDVIPHDRPAAVEDEDPIPEFSEEDLRLQEAIWAGERAKKAAAARAAKGQKSLSTSVVAASTRADVKPIGKASSAAVENEDPPPRVHRGGHQAARSNLG